MTEVCICRYQLVTSAPSQSARVVMPDGKLKIALSLKVMESLLQTKFQFWMCLVMREGEMHSGVPLIAMVMVRGAS